MRPTAGLVALAVLAVACSTSTTDTSPAATGSSTTSSDDAAPAVGFEPTPAAPAPDAPAGPYSDDAAAAVDAVFDTLVDSDGRTLDRQAVDALGETGDARVAWLIADLLRFFGRGDGDSVALARAFEALTGVTLKEDFPWGEATDHLIRWDLDAPPDYVAAKAEMFLLVEPGWAPFFNDSDAITNWRHVSWGGVLIDDRPLDAVDQPCPAGCIPALNDPAVTPAAGGDWYPDERLVFGVVVDGEARAYPRNIMEVHEMVNDELGGRRIAVPYCTLCGSAQAYLTDDVDPAVADELELDRYELRTSGLLVRSNKVMYEFGTKSLMDTFTGEATSGPLLDAGVVLEQLPVITATWADWRAAYPTTTIVAEDGGLGISYRLDPLGGRDDDGPIFPIGDLDHRLGVHDAVLGVVLADGTAIAFPVADLVRNGLAEVTFAGVRVVPDGGGYRVVTPNGDALPSHQSFWFAWSQFHPDTELWSG